MGFLLLGTLRSIDILKWRLEQFEATMPSRIGRSGLKPGKKAPDFTLPSVSGTEITLADYAARQVLLVFVQTGCSPCHAIVPELNRLVRNGELQVLAINNSDPEAVSHWAREVGAAFPVLVQEQWNISKRYEVFATPFAFLIDEKGTIVSKGIVNSKQHIGFMLDRRIDGAMPDRNVAEASRAEDGKQDLQHSISEAKEFGHD